MKTPTMRNFSVSLTLYHAAMMDAAVESGSYASNSEIIREGLRLWEMRQEIKKLEMARLRRLAVEDALGGDISEAEREIIKASLKADGLVSD
ncbi:MULTISPECIES: ribbon-helix-helix domain-containing protein [Rhizobium/Agrobacterium group]|uniref:ribbon-helix-helix domain-containing protein n=1 Tax=Rhizobium/Agrobacterium group TaxID=227290 RepID=UPI001CD886FE|nr:type II toxin-antitoxin system ParD family antitoxin [Rhizobium sp. SSA_523]MCO5734884.1 type II toxin-antitoxin system ParD family antitoxin [Rhizobium sp. SSA_523]WKC24786.1 type II toxin-antitoxin system ParD family antitoxin [Rhizobium sp. SSA_523]